MYKLKELDKDTYESFVKNNIYKSHFLQSYAWGEFAKEKKNKNVYNLGLYKDNTLVATALLLQTKLPLGYSYFYCPRGFVLNYEDEEVFNNMTKEIVKFAKANKAIFVKIDPDIIRKSINYKDEVNNLNYNPEKIFNMIKKAGFKHLGFTKNFETNNPRYSFRIDLTQSMEDIRNHYSKTAKQRIKKAKKLKTIVKIGTEKDLDTFCKLMQITEDRKDFVSYSNDYYKTLYNIFNKENKMTLFLGIVNIENILNDLKYEKEAIDNTINDILIDNNDEESLSKSQKNRLKEARREKEKKEKDIEKYSKYLKDYGKEITLNAHMIIEYGDKAWVLYAGNHNILTETGSNYKVYDEHIKYCKERGLKIDDQFGTIGDLSKDNPRIGLHEFKKKFGGDYVEFLGEFDYITNKLMYFIFNTLIPIYRKLVRNKSKKVIKNEVKGNK